MQEPAHPLQNIEKELAEAELALHNGNDGRARVQSRRAVGMAVSAWHELRGESTRRPAIEHLRHIAQDEALPAPVQKAAARLIKNVNDRLSADYTLHPVRDARTIISYFLQRLNP